MDNSSVRWITTTKRFVAYLDIMGFKDIVARNTHQSIYKRLCSLASTVYESKYNNVYASIFSDSIVVFSRNQSRKSWCEFIKVVSVIVNHSFLDGFGIKGAIAFGTITIDTEKQLFFGQPLIDAYLLEEDLCYFGVILHHTAEKQVCLRTCEKPMIELPTKLKSGVVTHINLAWPAFYKEISKAHAKPLELMNKFKTTMSGSPRRYLDNTIEFINRISCNNKILSELNECIDRR